MKKAPSGRPKKLSKVTFAQDDGSGDEGANIPPAKARKSWKDPEKKPKGINDIFSDDEIVPQPKKTKIVHDSDDDLEYDWPESLDVARSSTSMKPEKVLTPVPFSERSQLDIPSKCPDEDCDDNIIYNPSSSLITLFRDRAKVIQEQGLNAVGVLKLNIRICVQIKIEEAAAQRSRRAEKHGLVNVDFQALANRVWDLKSIIDPLMSGPEARSKIFIWTYLFDDLKSHSYSVARLNKGKDVPHEIVATARPGW
jgi:hypothetical protein